MLVFHFQPIPRLKMEFCNSLLSAFFCSAAENFSLLSHFTGGMETNIHVYPRGLFTKLLTNFATACTCTYDTPAVLLTELFSTFPLLTLPASTLHYYLHYRQHYQFSYLLDLSHHLEPRTHKPTLVTTTGSHSKSHYLHLL